MSVDNALIYSCLVIVCMNAENKTPLNERNFYVFIIKKYQHEK